jgi:uncharacterized RDD family membrane protein YckC
MKCPKCGYLGFETTDRCRNCQYDFSLAPFSSEPELTLQGSNRKIESPTEFELPPIKRPTDSLSATALDLDRLFGDPASPSASARADTSGAAGEGGPPPAPEPRVPLRTIEPPAMTVIDEDKPEEIEISLDDPELSFPAVDPIPDIAMSIEDGTATPAMGTVTEPEPATAGTAADESALPFDDGPIVPPPAARPPLAVRRSTPEVPRNRPRTTRPIRPESLNFDSTAEPKSGAASRDASETVASLMELPSLGARVGAGLIDLLLLVAIDAAVVYLTLRVTGLQNTVEDLRVLPTVPFVGFLALLSFGYVAAFTVAGGQTIGKMALSLRVIGDDGRPVDAAGGMLRAAGCMLVPITLGLSYLPALFTSDHRALHDRLAGTRVVQE